MMAMRSSHVATAAIALSDLAANVGANCRTSPPTTSGRNMIGPTSSRIVRAGIRTGVAKRRPIAQALSGTNTTESAAAVPSNDTAYGADPREATTFGGNNGGTGDMDSATSATFTG